MKKKTKKLVFLGVIGAGAGFLLLRGRGGGTAPLDRPLRTGRSSEGEQILADPTQLEGLSNYVTVGSCCTNCLQGRRCLG